MTGHVVSVITAVHAPAARYLDSAFASLQDQVMPPGWCWEWVLQVDGAADPIRDAFPAAVEDPRIRLDSGRAAGPAVARTLALGRAHGEIVQVLDADDRLAPGALSRVLGVLTEHSDLGWTTARAEDLLPDGSRHRSPHDADPGRLPRGFVAGYWRRNDHRLPVHPASLAARRDLLLGLGGWMALPASEDTGLVLALDATANGYFIDEVGLLYRKWPGQMTARPSHVDEAERAARLLVIDQRALALARSAAPDPAAVPV